MGAERHAKSNRQPDTGLSWCVTAQEVVQASVRAELAPGRKTSDRMWFVFPQLRTLGRSAIARDYGIEDLDETGEYWHHTLLG